MDMLLIVMRPAVRSVGALLTAPLADIWQHEQVQTGEQKQEEWEQRQEAHPKGKLLLPRSEDIEGDVDKDEHRKDNGQPTVGLSNRFVPSSFGDLL